MYIPGSTYRVQLHAEFNLCQLAGILPYLQALGITTVYFSPITTASAGSQHGYDVTDPLVLNPEIGSSGDLAMIAERLKLHALGWLQDIVPNHMAYDAGNRWLYDALERGRDSEHYGFFDIDTDSSSLLVSDKLMAPFLGKTLTECVQQGEIRLSWHAGGFRIGYFDQWFPVAVNMYSWILTVAEGFPADLADSVQVWDKLVSQSAGNWAVTKADWLRSVAANPVWLRFIEDRVEFINQRVGLLEELLQYQHYILTHHHLANSRINYRRFFTVNSLICLNMEQPLVFKRWHHWLLELSKKGWIDGLRVDHIDGLAAPREYIHRLREAFGKDHYIIAEKILGQDESLPDDWDLQGTTGYELAAQLNQLMTDAGGAHAIQTFYSREFSEDMPGYRDLVFEKKHRYLRLNMGGEWANLTDLLLRTTGIDAGQREGCKQALGVLMAAWPNYRVYPEAGVLPEVQQKFLELAFVRAQEHAPQWREELLLIRQVVETPVFFRRLMQFTGPLAAKGIEDTSFYIYNPLISHNEVGDDPGMMSLSVASFHARMQQRLALMPHSLNAGTTHDTKRGEDARIRLNYLSAIPEEWQAAVCRWRALNSALIVEDMGEGQRCPSLNDEYFIYQSLLGGFPSDMLVTDVWRGRFHGFLTKALREASVYTGYDQPNEAYEQQVHAFVAAILGESAAFLEAFIPFAHRVAKEAEKYSLAAQLLRLTAPGVPDIYQGSELWELSFVDPDNRRPVDYGLREQLLREMEAVEARGWRELAGWLEREARKGAAKLFVTAKVLRFRRDHPVLFAEGTYLPLQAYRLLEGGEALAAETDAVLAFARRYREQTVLIIVPLIREAGVLTAGLSLPMPAGMPLRWRDLFTGAIYEVTDGQLLLDPAFAEWTALLLTPEPAMP